MIGGVERSRKRVASFFKKGSSGPLFCKKEQYLTTESIGAVLIVNRLLGTQVYAEKYDFSCIAREK